MSYTTVANNLIDSGALDPYQGWILVRIARRGVCFESQRSIAKGTNISLAQVNRTIKWLHENGYIERKKHPEINKMGWAVVIQEEQTQQNSVIPEEQMAESVIPQERHLKKINTHTHTGARAKGYRRRGVQETAPNGWAGQYEHPPTQAEIEQTQRVEEMAAALATVTGMDALLNAESLNTFAFSLLENGYTSTQIQRAYGSKSGYWYQESFGKKGEKPRLGNIRNTVKQATGWSPSPKKQDGKEFEQVMALARAGKLSEFTGDLRAAVAKIGTHSFVSANGNTRQLQQEFYKVLNEQRTKSTATP